jgi:hypothetical protein
MISVLTPHMDAERLQSIKTDQDARSYIEHIISVSSPYDILRYVQAFYLPIDRHQRRRKSQKGGAIDQDARIYNLLALADSIHDAKGITALTVPKLIELSGMTRNDVPQDLTDVILSDERKFIKYMSTHKHLRFCEYVVRNPLYGIDLDCKQPRYPDKYIEKFKSYTDVEALSTFFHNTYRHKASSSSRTRCLHVSVVTEHDNAIRREKLQFRQVLLLTYSMRRWFGNMCVFQLDAQDPLIKFVTAVGLIEKNFHRKYGIERDFSGPAKYASDIRDIVDRAAGGVTTIWKATMCDANIYDGQTVGAHIETVRSPTGPVFSKEYPVKISLNGVSDTGTVCVVVNGKTHVLRTPEDASVLSSKQAVFARVLAHPDPQTAATELALKRAGDWGQVEHCKRYNSVFVTHDRLAAAYAHYRGVRYWLINVCSIQDTEYEHYWNILGGSA